MSIINTRTKTVPVETLQPHPENPRIGNVDAIAASISANGFYGSVIAREGTNDILAGSHRWKAAQQAGLAKIPVTFIDVDDATARRIMLADNRTSELGSYNDDALLTLLDSFSEDLVGTGYTDDDLNRLLRSTGARGEREGAFLADIDGESADLSTLDRVEVKQAPLTFMVSPEQKEAIIGGLRAVMEAEAIELMADALILVISRVR